MCRVTTGRRCRVGTRCAGSARESAVFDAVEGLVAEHAELEARLAAPETHADQRLAKRLNQRYAELSAIVRAWREWQRPRRRHRCRPRAARARTPDSPRRRRPLAERRVVAEEHLRHLLVPRDPADAKDALLEVKSGEGGEESALFAGDLLRMYSRYAERRGWRTEILDATESDLGGYKSVTVAVKAKGTPEPGEAPYAPAEVRGRRAPGAAGAGHRVAGPGAHQRRRRAGAARGRAGRRHGRRQRPAHRRLPLLRARRAERQHHRLGGADHAPADRHRGQLPEREVPAAEQGVGPAHPARPAARRRGGGGRRRGQRTRARARSAPSTAPSGSGPTTTRRTASPTTAPATRPTTSTRCSTATSSAVVASVRRRRPRRPGSRRSSSEPAPVAAARPRHGRLRRGRRRLARARRRRAAGPRARHHPRRGCRCVDVGRRRPGRGATRHWWRGAPPASRCST